jgi:hypothetical protein
MNKETEQILNYINKSGHYLDKIADIRVKWNNLKDFQLLVGYVIMEIVSQEKAFMHISRKNIEINLIAERYF